MLQISAFVMNNTCSAATVIIFHKSANDLASSENWNLPAAVLYIGKHRLSVISNYLWLSYFWLPLTNLILINCDNLKIPIKANLDFLWPLEIINLGYFCSLRQLQWEQKNPKPLPKIPPSPLGLNDTHLVEICHDLAVSIDKISLIIFLSLENLKKTIDYGGFLALSAPKLGLHTPKPPQMLANVPLYLLIPPGLLYGLRWPFPYSKCSLRKFLVTPFRWQIDFWKIFQ